MSGARGAPLLLTAELPPDIFALTEGLRRKHYPPERNHISAHVTLFHGLPPSQEAEIKRVVAYEAGHRRPPRARLEGIMPLGRGTAIHVTSPDLREMREELVERFHGMLTSQDDHELRFHITVQNKVTREEARALQKALEYEIKPRDFSFPALQLHAWRGGPWEFIQRWPFRGC